MRRIFTVGDILSSKLATSETQIISLPSIPKLTAKPDLPKASCGRREQFASLSRRTSRRRQSWASRLAFPTASLAWSRIPKRLTSVSSNTCSSHSRRAFKRWEKGAHKLTSTWARSRMNGFHFRQWLNKNRSFQRWTNCANKSNGSRSSASKSPKRSRRRRTGCGPAAIPNITTTDLHAGILAMAYRLHEAHGKQVDFTHVKAEKIAHMIEAFAGLELGRCPVKDAAGPPDLRHLKGVEHRAKMADYFLFQRVEGAAYRVTKYRKFDELVARSEEEVGDRRKEVNRLLDVMLPMDWRQAEIFATVYAAWNNLLLEGKEITDEKIALEAREHWHPDKIKIQREKFFRAIEWIKAKGFVPIGRGMKVAAKTG